MWLEWENQPLAGHRHGGGNVLLRINRGDREVAALHAGTMALVAILVSLAGIPSAFVSVYLVRAAVHAGAERDGVEDEEFILRSEQRRVGDSGSFQMRFRPLRQG